MFMNSSVLLGYGQCCKKSTTPSTRDLFHSEKSSTVCFPACYPPPPGEPKISPRKTLITHWQFKLTPSVKNEKSVANCSSADVPSLTAIFGKMSVTNSRSWLALKLRVTANAPGLPVSKRRKHYRPCLQLLLAFLAHPEIPNQRTQRWFHL